MTVLTACQSAALRINGSTPTSIFSSTGQLERELANLATDCAIEIAESHDWRGLTKIATLTGDGSRTSFPQPDDYDRMVQGQSVTNPVSWLWGYRAVQELDEWAALKAGKLITVVPGSWIELGGSFQFYPAPAAGQIANFAYISSAIGRSSTGTPLLVFAADADTFVLDERLLTLGIVWRWRSMKGLEYAEDLQTYEIALSRAQARDKGARRITKGSRYLSGDIRPAWPWLLGGQT